MISGSNSILGKMVGVGPEIHRRAAAPRRPHLLERALRRATLERQLPLRPVALHARAQIGGQRVDHAGADAVQASCGLVVAGLELPARVEHREDHLERALLRLRVLVHRNAAAVVGDRDRAAVGMQRDRDGGGVAVHRLVHRVVQDLPHQVMQAGAADAADVHAGPLANGLQPFKNRDVFGGVVGHVRARASPNSVASPARRTRGTSPAFGRRRRLDIRRGAFCHLDAVDWSRPPPATATFDLRAGPGPQRRGAGQSPLALVGNPRSGITGRARGRSRCHRPVGGDGQRARHRRTGAFAVLARC